MPEFTTLEIILALLGFSTALQALTAGLIFMVLKRAKASDTTRDKQFVKQDQIAEKTLQKALAANFAAAGLLELDATD